MAAKAESLLGRNAELAQIATALEGELPAALVLEGEAGIGKTRVWEEGLRTASAVGFRVLTTRAAGSEVQLSFAGLGDLLYAVVGDALPLLPRPQRRAVEAALLLEDPEDVLPDPRSVGLGFLGILRFLSEASPLIVAVDDLQWLDSPSGGALRFALRRLESEPIGLLCAVRGTPGAPLPFELGRAVGDDRLLRILLGPLSLGALHELLRSRLGLNVPRRTLIRVAETSGGNPFFALEIGRELQRRGIRPSAAEPLPVPDNLGELVRDRIVRLPARTRRLLLAAAALAQPTADVLEAASGDPRHADADLASALRAGVLELEGERVRFTHPLLAAVAYSEASVGERRRVHEALAGVASAPEERARHLALAGAGSDIEIAAALEHAAGGSAKRGAPDAAADLCEQAARLTPTGRDADRDRRTMAAAEYCFVAGETARARALLANRLPAISARETKVRALLLLAQIEHQAEGSDASVALCEQALAEPIDDSILEASAHTTLAAFSDLDNRRRADHARRALVLLSERKEANPALLSSALVASALGDYYVGRGLRREALERAVELEPDFARLPVSWRASCVFGQLLKYTDDYDRARGRLTEAYRLALDEGDDSSLPDVAAHLSELELWTGDWAVADRYARESLDAAERSEQEFARGIGYYCRALVDAHLGRIDSARSFAEQGLVIAGDRSDLWLEGICLWVLGFLELSSGAFDAAERQLARAEEIADAIGLVEPGQWRFHPDRIEALIHLRRHDEAERLLERYESRAQTVARAFALAGAARCRGLLVAAVGDLDRASELLAGSIGRYERLPLPFERARTLLAIGSVERRAQRKRAARETLEQSLDSFNVLGAPLWAAKARSELGRIGGRRAPSRGSLSETEAQIAELAAAGRTNAEIAAELVISPKTVKWNLSKVYGKLGVRSRTELAAALASRPHPTISGPVRE
jgi:DNA-binding CsgD family transcriptional regulator